MRCGQEVLGKFHVFSLLDKFHFLWCKSHYYALSYPKAAKENKSYTKNKIELQRICCR